jgi:glycosyltransferase involved in cell wall biosynthesis
MGGPFMPKDLSILVVAYYFPPNAAVGGKRIARFCQYLPGFGIHPSVLTLDKESCASLDLSFAKSNDIPVERTRPNSTPLDWYRRAAHSRSSKTNKQTNSSADTQPKTGVWSYLSQSAVALLTIPDKQWGWYLPAVHAGAKLIGQHKFDAIMSSGPPWTAHAVGHKLSQRFKIPWIVDFRDAWVSDHWRDEHPNWRNKVDWRIEDRWLKHASLVLTTTERLRESLLTTHAGVPTDRVKTITNGFDGNSLGSQKPVCAEPKNSVVFLHTGELYRGRRIDTLCSALDSLLKQGAFGSKVPKVIFIGETDPEIERTARASAPELFDAGMIQFRPPVTWNEVQVELAAADILLLVQGDHPTAIPAKFFEYLQSGKPILGIGQGGALKDMIEDTKSGFVADPRSEDAISAAIRQTLEMKPRSADEIAQFAGKYHFKNLSAVLADNIRRITS